MMNSIFYTFVYNTKRKVKLSLWDVVVGKIVSRRGSHIF
jgi:hypothetical protein